MEFQKLHGQKRVTFFCRLFDSNYHCERREKFNMENTCKYRQVNKKLEDGQGTG